MRRRRAAEGGATERAIMDQTRHRSLKQVRKYIRRGSLFRENAAAKSGRRRSHGTRHHGPDPTPVSETSAQIYPPWKSVPGKCGGEERPKAEPRNAPSWTRPDTGL